MEKYKTSRAALRTSFTKKIKQLEAAILDENRDMAEIRILMELIEKKHEELADIDLKIYEELLAGDIDQAALEQEIDNKDAYFLKWSNIKLKVAGLKEDTMRVHSVQNADSNVILESKRPFKLPQLELKKFSGELKEWLPFWTQYNKIHEDPSIDDGDKFQYLIQATVPGSRARVLVDSFPAIKENYRKVVDCLKARYGREDLLVEFYVRDLLNLVLQNTLGNEKMSLVILYDKLESRLRALESLHVTTERCAAMLMPLVESCLPEEILRTWQRSRVYTKSNLGQEDDTNTPQNRLEHLMTFLRTELENEEKIKLALTGFSVDDVPKISEKRKESSAKSTIARRMPTATGLLTTTGEINCVFCNNNHSNSGCTKAQKMSVKERKMILDKRRGCYNCLKIGHRASSCWNRSRCIVCGKKHNILLCENLNEAKNSVKPEKESSVKTNLVSVNEKTLTNIEKSPKVFLQTLVVKLRGNGYERSARAIIDSASQRSYILQSTAREMKYECIRKEYVQHALFGGLNSGIVQHEVHKIHLSNVDDTYRCNFEVLDQKIICDRIPPISEELLKEELTHFDIKLTDYEDRPIEILIGADVCGKLFTGRKQLLNSGLVAIETDLGWTIIGRAPERVSSENVAMTVTAMLVKEADISDLWSLDVIGIEDPTEKKKKCELQAAAEEHFLNTVSKDKENRYLVHLPWIENHPTLSDNYSVALKRLYTTIKKLKSEGLYDEYDLVFREWLQEEIIEEVPPDELDLPSHYLPHRHVIKENSTTRIRPVFDASAREKNKPSLNNCVEKGKNLIELIPSILTRFRMNKIGVVSDIRKAFLQIGLVEQDRNFLRFLWVDKKGQLKIFRHRRVVFGVSCSPFLLGSVINYHLKNTMMQCKNNEKNYSMDVINQLLNSFYVDNCITSVNDKQELELFVTEATAIMAEGKFDLRGWEYTQQSLIDESDENSNVLGIIWNKNLDTLEVNVESFNSFDISQVTKRTILSAAHKLFDPIGAICPVLLSPKLLLQQICMSKIGWDQEVDDDIKNKFINWYRDLFHLKQVKISRWILNSDKPTCCSIHVFCDASQNAYAAAVFLRTVTVDKVSVQLIQAKSRIAPLQKQNKRMTIPRLELLAATVGVRLYESVVKDLTVSIDEVIFWSDSTTVLAWITREEQWDIFVRNRVAEIRQFTSKHQWRHVPGTDNPADLPSRGCSARKLITTNWWIGPDWLSRSPEHWPSAEVSYDEEEINKERKKSVISSCTMICNSGDTDWYYRYFSDYKKIVRLVAWIIRFRRNALMNTESRISGELSYDEFSYAEERILYLIQQESFIGLDDPKLSTLCPFLDENGLIRIKMKASNRDDLEDFCYPIVLPSQMHPVVNRLILNVHKESSHAGVQTMLSLLRRRFWILSSRRSIRSVINNCIICKRYKTKRIEVQSPPLPIDRVRDAKIFEIVGVDLAGPVYIKERETGVCRKSWICLFTCAVYRAIHLELISSLSTDRFLQCLRKFISRRGRPAVIYSDNGTNFVGSANALSRVDWNKVSEYSTVRSIRWKFNPPTAAWWGGWWERLVGLLKQLLRRVLGRTSLDFEEMQTILCECETVINSRPLTYVSEDSSELIPLTPNMFLQEIQEVGTPDLDGVEVVDPNRRLRYRKQLRDSLKQRFRDEYLGQLVLHARRCPSRSVKVGDVVMVETDNTKRLDWPLARVEEIIPGREGVVRLVKLRTSSGMLLRPVQKIYPLEIEFGESEEDKGLSRRIISGRSRIMTDTHHEDRVEVEEESEQHQSSDLVKSSRYGRQIKAPLRLNL